MWRDWSKELSQSEEKWALLGSKLGLIAEDSIHYYKKHPYMGVNEGNGELILALWKLSDCSYRELVAVLRDEDIRLDELASQIQAFFTTT